MARKKEKRYFPLDDLFCACDAVYHVIVEHRGSGRKIYDLQKRRGRQNEQTKRRF